MKRNIVMVSNGTQTSQPQNAFHHQVYFKRIKISHYLGLPKNIQPTTLDSDSDPDFDGISV